MPTNPFASVRIEAISVADQVYDAVKDAIIEARLIPGSLANEVELSTRLHVSRTPLREALRKLEAEGLLHRRDGRLLIPDLSAEELADLYDIRARLEGLAARQAAERASEDEVVMLRQVAERIQTTVYASPREVLIHGEEFHTLVAEVARNRRNLAFLRMNLDHISRYRILVPEAGRPMFAADHLAIVAALEVRDPSAAERAAVNHVLQSRHRIAAQLNFEDRS